MSTSFRTDREEREAGGSVVRRIRGKSATPTKRTTTRTDKEERKRNSSVVRRASAEEAPTKETQPTPHPTKQPQQEQRGSGGGLQSFLHKLGMTHTSLDQLHRRVDVAPEARELSAYASAHASPTTYYRELEANAAVQREIRAGRSTYTSPTLADTLTQARLFEHKPTKQTFQRGTEGALQRMEFLPHTFAGDVARGVVLSGPMSAQTPALISDVVDMPKTTAADIAYSLKERPGIAVGAAIPALVMGAGGAKTPPTTQVVVAEGVVPFGKGFAIPIKGSRGAHITHVETLTAREQAPFMGTELSGKYAGVHTVGQTTSYILPEFYIMAVQKGRLGARQGGWIRTHGGGIEVGRMRMSRGGKVDVAAIRERMLTEPEPIPVWQDIATPISKEPLAANIHATLEEWRASLLEPVSRGVGAVPKEGSVAVFHNIPETARTHPQVRKPTTVIDVRKARTRGLTPTTQRPAAPQPTLQPPSIKQTTARTELTISRGVEVSAGELKSIQKALKELTTPSKKTSSIIPPVPIPRYGYRQKQTGVQKRVGVPKVVSEQKKGQTQKRKTTAISITGVRGRVAKVSMLKELGITVPRVAPRRALRLKPILPPAFTFPSSRVGRRSTGRRGSTSVFEGVIPKFLASYERITGVEARSGKRARSYIGIKNIDLAREMQMTGEGIPTFEELKLKKKRKGGPKRKRSSLMKDTRAQLTIMGIMTMLVAIIIMSSITPIIIEFTSNASSQLSDNGDTMAAMIVSLVPLFMWLGIITSIVFYVRPLLVREG